MKEFLILVGLGLVTIITFIVYMNVRNFRRSRFAQLLITPKYMNQEMLNLLIKYNAFSYINWEIIRGCIVKHEGTNYPTVYSGLEYGDVMLINRMPEVKMICALESEPWGSLKKLPNEVDVEKMERINCGGSLQGGFTLHDWNETISYYSRNILSRDFENAIIKVAGN